MKNKIKLDAEVKQALNDFIDSIPSPEKPYRVSVSEDSNTPEIIAQNKMVVDVEINFSKLTTSVSEVSDNKILEPGPLKYYRGYSNTEGDLYEYINIISNTKDSVTYSVLDKDKKEIIPERTVKMNFKTQCLKDYRTGEVEDK